MNREHAEKPMTDEAFSELLAGRLREDSADEVKAMQAALRTYRDETLVWAERRSAAKPSLAAAAKRSAFLAAVPQWSLAAVATLTVAVGLVHFTGDRGAQAVADVPAVAVQERAVSTEQIAADNSLLTNIDSALAYDSETPAVDIGVTN